MPSTSPGAILHGDASAILKQLLDQDARYDVIIADPPYNIGKDFGNDYAPMPIDEYIQWTAGWVNDCLELLTDDGLVYIYGFPEIIARVSARYPLEMQRWLVWHYTNKAAPLSRFWQRSHEAILCMWKPGRNRPDIELDQIREPYTAAYIRTAGQVRKSTPSRYGGDEKDTVYNAHVNGALPRDVINVPALAGRAGMSERWFICNTCSGEMYQPQELINHRNHDVFKHPTQKPMELTRRLIRSRINGTNGRVLVPFAGSGSECVVAQALGIEYLGIEINPEYVAFARKWLLLSGKYGQQLDGCDEMAQMSLW